MVMLTSLETQRLLIRPFVEADADAVFRYRQDPEVMRFIPGGADKSLEDTQRVIDKYNDHQQAYGFSKWAIVLKETGQLIGDSGLLLLERGPDFELGYRLIRKCWHMGFATEAGHAWLRAAFSQLSLQRVVAFAHPDHSASIRVMSKLGMRFERHGRFYGMEAILYSIYHDTYLATVKPGGV
jgi:ribosomal-protein-alanine N-acetyltransferase